MVKQGSMQMNYSQLNDNELDYFEIAPCSDLPEGERLFLEIGGMKIVIINIGEKIVAIGDLCTHDQGPLGDGEIDHEEIVCPRHGARFNILTGKATSLPAVIDIPAYRVKIVDEMILVGIPKTGKDSN
jgi:3-phenylpropionate/trans-cinnamate dioxygenase ferredoxin component